MGIVLERILDFSRSTARASLAASLAPPNRSACRRALLSPKISAILRVFRSGTSQPAWPCGAISPFALLIVCTSSIVTAPSSGWPHTRTHAMLCSSARVAGRNVDSPFSGVQQSFGVVRGGCLRSLPWRHAVDFLVCADLLSGSTPRSAWVRKLD